MLDTVATQFRYGTTAECEAMTPLLAEPIMDTDKKTIRAGDGATAGGHPLATEAMVLGKQSVYLPARLFTPNPAQPCAALATQHFSAANKPVLDYLAFDGAVSETAGLHLALPARWDLSDLRARIHWAPVAAGTVGESVFWRFYAQGFADGDSLDTAYSFVTVSDDLVSASAWRAHLTDWSPTREVANAADYGVLGLNVVRTGATDSYAGDAAFLGLVLEFNTDQAKDS